MTVRPAPLAEPTHTFATAGLQSVTLTVTDNEGGTGTVTKTVTTVANQLPTGSFTSAVTKQQVSFTSTANDADGTVATYLWDFGDGSATSTLANPIHTFPAVDTYSVSLDADRQRWRHDCDHQPGDDGGQPGADR